MKTFITIEIDENDVYIAEENCTGESYHLKDENWPAVIDDICGCLHDYLEGLE